MLTSKPNLWGREPALILGALQAVIALAISFGLDLTTVQVGGILAASAAILALVTRTQVTPTSTVAATEPEPVEAPGAFAAGPAADVPEGAPVEVVQLPGDKDGQQPTGGYWGGI